MYLGFSGSRGSIRAERISEGNHVKVAVPSIGVTYEGDVDGNNITGQFKRGGLFLSSHPNC